MGHNIDFVWLLGLPEKVECPRCRREVHSGFEDYDIDCGDPQASMNNNKMRLDVTCNKCEYEFGVNVKIEIEVDKYKE